MTQDQQASSNGQKNSLATKMEIGIGGVNGIKIDKKETKQEAEKKTTRVEQSSTHATDGGLQVPSSNGRVVEGRNFAANCLAVIEPEADEEITGERKAYMASVLAKYQKKLIERTEHFLGYPCNLDYDYSDLANLQHYSINNVGDPSDEANYGIHSREFERGVLNWFAKLWGIKENKYWGYITGGGTEGNMHGILVGRKMFPDGILYTSRESHCSVFKIADMYQMECVEIKSLSSGEIDCEGFKTKLLRNKDKPAIVNVNIGSTVKGATDDLDLVIKTLQDTLLNNNDFYIHCDAAQFGMMLPFVKWAPKTITFEKPIGSVSVSGHKFVGCPMPCGVYITRKENMTKAKYLPSTDTSIKDRSHRIDIEILFCKDITIMGSRNGHTPIYLWYALNRKGYEGFRKEVSTCLTNARKLFERLDKEGIGAMLNKHSNTVVFERPKDEDFVRKWQLACQGKIAHVVVMPNVTEKKLEDFVKELVEKRSSWLKDGKNQVPCIAEDIGKENCACSQHDKHVSRKKKT